MANKLSLTPEAIYQRLGRLAAEMPDLARGPINREMYAWLGRAAALVDQVDDYNASRMRTAAHYLNGSSREGHAHIIASAFYEALGKAELLAPASAQGAFIAGGDTFDALAVVAKALSEAKEDVFLLDKYADSVVLTDYAILAPESVSVRLLAKNGRKDLLKPAMDRWREQWGNTRPLEVRLAPQHSLHDRAIFLDKKTAWMLGQSFNGLAKSHTTLVKLQTELSVDKIEAYEALWVTATPL